MKQTAIRFALVVALLGTAVLFAGPVAADSTVDVSADSSTTVNGQTTTVGVDSSSSQAGSTTTVQVNDQEQTVAVP